VENISKENKLLAKRLKNCGKIIFSAWQIATSLPSVVPTIPLPDTYKQAVAAAQVLNANLFQFVPVGCFTGGTFSYYYQVLCTTLIIITACVVLVLLGAVSGETKRDQYFNATLALTYLTLPTISTMLFGMIPCDELDNESTHLRADYTIDCDDASRPFWSLFTAAMTLLFPIGVPSSYFFMLWRNKAKITKPGRGA